MSGRNLRARLDKLAQALGDQKVDAAVCRFHGTACRLGANWPLPYPEGPTDALLDAVADARRSLGQTPAPHPRDVWKTDEHEQVPQEELDREKRELDELVAGLRAKNDQIEAALRAGRMSEGV